MEKIIVDGIDYIYLVINSLTIDTIILYDTNDNILADATIDNNCEFIGVQYYNETEVAVNTSFPYYEYENPERLAMWLASTYHI